MSLFIDRWVCGIFGIFGFVWSCQRIAKLILPALTTDQEGNFITGVMCFLVGLILFSVREEKWGGAVFWGLLLCGYIWLLIHIRRTDSRYRRKSDQP
jgi:hypothetical protein